MATLRIGSDTLGGWNDSHPVVELWIFSDSSWVDAYGESHGAGSPNDRIFTQRVTGLTVSTVARTITIPAFDLIATEDALVNPGVRLYAWFMAIQGASASPIKSYPGLENGFTCPASITSATGCSPLGLCCSLSELVIHSKPQYPQAPVDNYYTMQQIDRIVLAQLTGAPAGATYILQKPNSTLINAQALNQLPTGLLKNTTATGILSGAVAETDYSSPLTFAPPLIRTTNAISIQTASGSQAGALSAADWTTFNNKLSSLSGAELLANKNATNGYAGLSGGKVASAQIAEVLGLSDLTDVTGASGVGTIVPKGTFTSLTVGDRMTWDGTNWMNQAPTSGSVTSFSAGNLSPLFTSNVATATSTPALTFTLLTQSANVGFFGPTTGSAAAPTFRALVVADLPVVDVPHGGSGLSSLTAFAVLAGGTTTTGNLQQVSGLGTAAQVLTSNGAGTLPTWQNAPSGTHAFLSASITDATPSAPVRGGIVTAQGSGTPLWAQLARGTQYQVLQANANDVVYDAVHLDQAAAVTGILGAAKGGSGVDASAAANGALLIGNGAGFTLATLIQGSNITITNTAGGIQIDSSVTAGTNWDGLASPATTNLALSMAAKTTTFTWNAATGSGVDLFVLKDSASNSGTGHVFAVNTAASSNAKTIGFFARGTADGVEMSTVGVLAATGAGGITATALNGVSSNGFQARTSAGNFSSRTFADAAGITWTNPAGTAGDPSAALNLATLVNSQTIWDGANATRTLTFAVTGTDPVMSFSASSVDVTTGTLKQGGVAVVLTSRTLTGGNGINTIGDLSVDRTISIAQDFSPTWTGLHIWTPTARSSGSAAYFTINTPADTGITASTESIGFKTVTAIRTWAAGALTTQRENVFAAPTYAASGTSTFSTTATVAITGAPISGSNVTQTTPLAFWVQGGNARFDGTFVQGAFRDKGGMVFNVLAYGAVADGSTDDSAAFTSAIAAAAAVPGGIVFVPAGTYAWASEVDIGDGTSTTVGTYVGVRLIGIGNEHADWTVQKQAVKIKWTGSTSTSNIMLKLNGPIAGVTVEGIVFDCNNKAGIGIQSKHAEETTIRGVSIVNFTSIGLDVDDYNTTSFSGTTTGNYGYGGRVERINMQSGNNGTSSTNRLVGIRLGLNGPLSQWNFYGGKIRLDGTTNSTVVQLRYCDHNNFWGLVGKAEHGVDIRSIAGHTDFPINNFFNSCAIYGTTASNSYTIDTTDATWAPTSPYGQPLIALPTVDGGSTTTPTNTKFWGFDDRQRFFGNWSFRDALTVTGGIIGTATNDAATAGNVGEELTASASLGSVSMTSATGKTITSISLTAGDWDVTGSAHFSPSATATIAEWFACISLTNNTVDVTPGRFVDHDFKSATTLVALTHTLPRVRLSLASTTTVYLVGLVTFAGSGSPTVSTGGKITARRVR